jgi:hypothetical protein
MTAVDEYLSALEHPRAAEVRNLVNLISTEFPEFNSEVKWNAPSFAIDGLNIVTLRLFPAPHLQIILHVGSKKAPAGLDLRFDVTGVEHTWLDPCRCQLIVASAANTTSGNSNSTANSVFTPVISAIRQWIIATGV